MKRLLLLLPLLLTPAAQAVDYVKCEAMQKAAGRVNADIRSYKKTINTRYREQATTEICGPGSAIQAAWYDCAWGHGLDKILARWSELKEADPVLKAKELRAQKIQADYDAEGCY